MLKQTVSNTVVLHGLIGRRHLASAIWYVTAISFHPASTSSVLEMHKRLCHCNSMQMEENSIVMDPDKLMDVWGKLSNANICELNCDNMLERIVYSFLSL